MIKIVNCGIDNLTELEKLEEKEYYTVNTYFMGLSEMAADFGVSTEINWSVLYVPDNLDYDVILVTFSVSVGKKFLIRVRHL